MFPRKNRFCRMFGCSIRYIDRRSRNRNSPFTVRWQNMMLSTSCLYCFPKQYFILYTALSASPNTYQPRPKRFKCQLLLTAGCQSVMNNLLMFCSWKLPSAQIAEFNIYILLLNGGSVDKIFVHRYVGIVKTTCLTGRPVCGL